MTNTKNPTARRPRVLVLDSWAGDASRAVTRQGGIAITVSPNNIDAIERALFDDGAFDALLLTGGGDVDPRQYDEKPHKKVYGVSEVRDYNELVALDFAEESGIPVLGICRGSQLMAVHNGGRLKQHIRGHRGVNHLVFTEAGTTFRKVIGERGFFVSLHHQTVIRHGNGWRVAARDAKGGIEAVESKDGRCLGVQFHPEMDTSTNECSRRIFRWLVLEAAKRAGLKVPRKPRRKKAKAKAWVPAQFPAGPPLPKPRTFAPRALSPGDRTLAEAARRGRAPVKVSWFCPSCGMRFDDQQDREDHITWLHGEPIISVTQPPPGHPDWEG